MRSSSGALLSVAATIALTVVHHLYGAWRYDTPWRHHVAIIVLPIFALLLVAYVVQRLKPRTHLGAVALWLFVVGGGAVAVLWIGLFEGGYAHLVKNVAYFAGVSDATFARFFPAPTFEVPDDAVFEITGIAQLALGLSAAWYLRRYWRESART